MQVPDNGHGKMAGSRKAPAIVPSILPANKGRTNVGDKMPKDVTKKPKMK